MVIQGAICRPNCDTSSSGPKRAAPWLRSIPRLLAGADVMLPVEMPYARHVYHIYAIRSAVRDDLAAELKDKGIQTGIHYPIPVICRKPTPTRRMAKAASPTPSTSLQKFSLSDSSRIDEQPGRVRM